MLGHRLRRWPNIETALGEWLVFAGYKDKKRLYESAFFTGFLHRQCLFHCPLNHDHGDMINPLEVVCLEKRKAVCKKSTVTDSIYQNIFDNNCQNVFKLRYRKVCFVSCH